MAAKDVRSNSFGSAMDRLPCITKEDDFSEMVASVLSPANETDLQQVLSKIEGRVSNYTELQHKHGKRLDSEKSTPLRRSSSGITNDMASLFELEAEERQQIQNLWQEVRAITAMNLVKQRAKECRSLYCPDNDCDDSESTCTANRSLALPAQMNLIRRRRLMSFIETNFNYIFVEGVEGKLSAMEAYELADTIIDLPYLLDGNLNGVTFSAMPSIVITAETCPPHVLQMFYSHIGVKAAFKSCKLDIQEWHKYVIDFFYHPTRLRPQRIEMALRLMRNLTSIAFTPAMPGEEPIVTCTSEDDVNHVFAHALDLEQRWHRPYDNCDNTITLQYQRGEQIGKGGFGTVFRCTNVANGQFLALKEVPLRKEREQEIRIEVDTLKRLSNKNVVKYFGCRFDRERAKVQVLMEYAPKSLREVAVGSKGLALPLIANYARKILDGLAYLHEHRIIHRDIKAANVLVTESGEAKLTDFGTALLVDAEEPQSPADEKTDVDSTKAKEAWAGDAMTSMRRPSKAKSNGPTLQGTPLFMAPELMRGCLPSETSDIWSFGCLLLELITGVAPWQELLAGGPVATEALLYKIGQATERPQLPDNIEVTPEFLEVLDAALAIDPTKRPPASVLRQYAFLIQDGEDAARMCQTTKSAAAFGGSDAASINSQGASSIDTMSTMEVMGPAQRAARSATPASASPLGQPSGKQLFNNSTLVTDAILRTERID